METEPTELTELMLACFDSLLVELIEEPLMEAEEDDEDVEEEREIGEGRSSGTVVSRRVVFLETRESSDIEDSRGVGFLKKVL